MKTIEELAEIGHQAFRKKCFMVKRFSDIAEYNQKNWQAAASAIAAAVREERAEEVERLREALRWIAEEANTGEGGDSVIMAEFAREVLEGK